jgi:nucleoid-associated protein YgaU
MNRYNKKDVVELTSNNLKFRLSLMQQSNRKLINQMKTNSFAHIVKEGERIEKIAFIYFNDEKDWPAIAILNDITNPWNIIPGQVLLIPIDTDSIMSLLDFWRDIEPNIHMVL